MSKRVERSSFPKLLLLRAHEESEQSYSHADKLISAVLVAEFHSKSETYKGDRDKTCVLRIDQSLESVNNEKNDRTRHIA